MTAGTIETLEHYAELTRAAMAEAIAGGEPADYLYDLVRDYAARKGKGLRPGLLLAAADACGEPGPLVTLHQGAAGGAGVVMMHAVTSYAVFFRATYSAVILRSRALARRLEGSQRALAAHPSRLAARGGEHLRMTAVFVSASAEVT